MPKRYSVPFWPCMKSSGVLNSAHVGKDIITCLYMLLVVFITSNSLTGAWIVMSSYSCSVPHLELTACPRHLFSSCASLDTFPAGVAYPCSLHHVLVCPCSYKSQHLASHIPSTSKLLRCSDSKPALHQTRCNRLSPSLILGLLLHLVSLKIERSEAQA